MLTSSYLLLFLFSIKPQNQNVIAYDNPAVLENMDAITSLFPFCRPTLIFHGLNIHYDYSHHIFQPTMVISCIKYRESYQKLSKNYLIINNTCNLFTRNTRNYSTVESETIFMSDYRRNGKSGGCNVFYVQNVRQPFKNEMYKFDYKGMYAPSVYFVLLTIQHQNQDGVINEEDIWWEFRIHVPYHSIVFFVSLIYEVKFYSRDAGLIYLKIDEIFVQWYSFFNFWESLVERKRILVAKFDDENGWKWPENVWPYNYANLEDVFRKVNP